MADTDEITRLRAAIAGIHDHLHAGRINEAHEACECAMTGGEVKQTNLTLPQSAAVQTFAARFNAMCGELGILAAFIAWLPSATTKGHTSVQLGGAVDVCKFLEVHLARAPWSKMSLYQGDHEARGARG